MNKQTLNGLFIHTIIILAMTLLMLSCGPSGFAKLPVESSSLTPDEATVREAVLDKLALTLNYVAELETVPVYATNLTEVQELCNPVDKACTDIQVVVIQGAHPAFCRNLVHEYMHIAKFHQTGNADKGHSDTTLFNQYPDQFCADIENPFFAKPLCNGVIFGSCQ